MRFRSQGGCGASRNGSLHVTVALKIIYSVDSRSTSAVRKGHLCFIRRTAGYTLKKELTRHIKLPTHFASAMATPNTSSDCPK